MIHLDCMCMSKCLVKLTFIHMSVGSGIPFGGPHSNNAVSPLATRVSLGWARKSSRKTEINKKRKNKKIVKKVSFFKFSSTKFGKQLVSF